MQKEDVINKCDLAIIELANGNIEALSTIYDLMSRNIYVTALVITENHADAEDIVQDTMLQIVKYVHAYRKGTNPRAWILTMARHGAIDTIRKRRYHTPIDELSLQDEAVNDDIEAVLTLLSGLDTSERELVLLRLYEEISYEEIAKIMKISVFAAQKRYQRALKKLQRINNERSYEYGRERNKESFEKT